MKLKKGFFITFEGVEGSGKSAQVKLLAQNLQNLGYKIYLTKEPGAPDIPLNVAIRNILLSFTSDTIPPFSEFMLFAADRARHTEAIKQHLKQKEIVISDRFSESSDAYQGIARNVGLKFTQFVNKTVTGGLQPNLTFLLDINPKKGLSRKQKNKQPLNRLDKESSLFHSRVREGYLKLAKNNRRRIIVINGDRPLQDIQKEIFKKVLEKIKN